MPLEPCWDPGKYRAAWDGTADGFTRKNSPGTVRGAHFGTLSWKFRMISVNNITMRYGAKILFEDVTTAFVAGRRYGLTGPNGSGKSTFMKLLSGEMEPQKGTVVRPKKIGILRQDQFAFDEFRVVDTVIMGNMPLWKALEERETLYAKAELTDEDGMRLGE